MEKRTYLPLIFLLASFSILILPSVSAVQINMNPSFNQGETLFAQISGNFLDQIQQSNILLYEGHVRIPFTPSVNKAGGIFYVYGQLQGKESGNYSLVLRGVRYIENDIVKSSDVSRDFTITNNSAEFSVSPGFISLSYGGTFQIGIRNLKDSVLNLDYSLGNFSNKSVIPPGQTVKASLSSPLLSGMYNLTLSGDATSYQVPVYIEYSSSTSTSNYSGNGTSLPKDYLKIQPSSLNISLSTNSTTARYLHISSSSNVSTNISFSVQDILKPYISIQKSATIEANSSSQIKINVTSLENNSVTLGDLNATYGNQSILVPIFLNFSADYVFTNQSSGSQNNSLFQTCSEIGGISCGGNEACTGEIRDALDGKCCFGTCKVQQNDNSGKILGWTLAAILVLGLVTFLIFKYRKAKRPFKFSGIKTKSRN